MTIRWVPQLLEGINSRVGRSVLPTRHFLDNGWTVCDKIFTVGHRDEISLFL